VISDLRRSGYESLFTSVADPDPGSGAFLTPGSGIRNGFFPDPGSRISDPGSRMPRPYFEELFDNFFGKKFYNSLKIGPNFFLYHFKTKIIYNFVKFCGYIKRFNI
jgi:hypothetical protein